MDMVLQDWHWLIFGMLLMAAEIFIPSFTIFWFGLGAACVALLLWLIPDTAFSVQLAVWSASTIMFAVFWFYWFKPRMKDRTKAGIAREAVAGESGQVIRKPTEHSRGWCVSVRRYWVMMSGSLFAVRMWHWVTVCL